MIYYAYVPRHDRFAPIDSPPTTPCTTRPSYVQTCCAYHDAYVGTHRKG